MIGVHLLPHSVTPVPSVVQLDDYGNPVRVPGPPGAPVPAFVQPLEPSEDTAEGQVRENRLKVFVNPELELDAWSHLQWEGQEYELIGDSRRHDTPAGPHHVVLIVRRVGA